MHYFPPDPRHNPLEAYEKRKAAEARAAELRRKNRNRNKGQDDDVVCIEDKLQNNIDASTAYFNAIVPKQKDDRRTALGVLILQFTSYCSLDALDALETFVGMQIVKEGLRKNPRLITDFRDPLQTIINKPSSSTSRETSKTSKSTQSTQTAAESSSRQELGQVFNIPFIPNASTSAQQDLPSVRAVRTKAQYKQTEVFNPPQTPTPLSLNVNRIQKSNVCHTPRREEQESVPVTPGRFLNTAMSTPDPYHYFPVVHNAHSSKSISVSLPDSFSSSSFSSSSQDNVHTDNSQQLITTPQHVLTTPQQLITFSNETFVDLLSQQSDKG